MQGLWADGWFYISALGLLVSGALFFVLLGQYRAAAEAADRREGDMDAVPSVSPVLTPVSENPRPLPQAAPEPAPVAKAEPAPAPAPAATPAPSPKESSSGGLSPAIAFLQNIKA